MTSNAKLAVVTGACGGLGRNMAIALARKGVDLIGTYYSNKAEADGVAAAIEALGRKAAMFQLDTGRIAGFASFAANLKRALAEGWSVQILTLSSTTPASAFIRPSRKPLKPTSTG